MEKKGACLRSYNNKKNSCVCGQKKKTTVPVINIQSKWRKDGENIKREILLLITMITNNTEQNFHIAQNLTLRVKRVIKCKLKKSKSYPKLRN